MGRLLLNLAIKVTVTLVTFYIVARAVSPAQLMRVLAGAELGWFVLAAALFLLAQAVSAQRHLFVIRRLGGRITPWRAQEVHFIGLWFNQVFPTSLGGDIVKAAMLTTCLGTGLAIRSVLLDRLSGLIVILLSILLLLPWYGQLFRSGWVAFGLGVGASGALALILIAPGLRIFARGRLGRLPGARHVMNLLDDIWQFRRRPALLEQLATSGIVHCNGVLAYALIGKGLHVEAEWLTYFLLTPLLFLITLVPVSLAGWGVRELGAVWLFGIGGVAQESALLISILFGVLLLVAAIPGGILILLSSGSLFRGRRGS